MPNRNLTDRLTPDEAARVREIIAKHGEKEAQTVLGLFDRLTVYKCGCGASVHVYTVLTVRARLGEKI